jgi:hypothetical protein
MASKTFSNVTQAIWTCVQTTSVTENGTVYDPPPPSSSGTATTKTIVGDVVLSYAFDSGPETVTYTIVKKPFIVSEKEIWDGIQSTIDGCSSS